MPHRDVRLNIFGARHGAFRADAATSPEKSQEFLQLTPANHFAMEPYVVRTWLARCPHGNERSRLGWPLVWTVSEQIVGYDFALSTNCSSSSATCLTSGMEKNPPRWGSSCRPDIWLESASSA